MKRARARGTRELEDLFTKWHNEQKKKKSEQLSSNMSKDHHEKERERADADKIDDANADDDDTDDDDTFTDRFLHYRDYLIDDSSDEEPSPEEMFAFKQKWSQVNLHQTIHPTSDVTVYSLLICLTEHLVRSKVSCFLPTSNNEN